MFGKAKAELVKIRAEYDELSREHEEIKLRFRSAMTAAQLQEATILGLEGKLSEVEQDLKDTTERLNAQFARNEVLEKENARLSAVSISDVNSVRIVISNDLTTGTPHIAYREDCFESLFQSGVLADGQNSPQAIQLGLINIASEILNQIVDSFVEEPLPDD